MKPLHEGKRRLTGDALTNCLAKLERLATEENAKAKAAKMGRDDYRACASEAGAAYLEHVRKAGEWYDEIAWRMGRGRRWGKRKQKLTKKHGIAPRTLDQYRDVARNWNHPKIEEARAQGIVIDSIKKFMAIKRSGPPKALPKVTAKQMERDNATCEIRKKFAEYLKSLDSFEVGILHATLDEVLAVANADLKERVCGNYGGPYYKHRDEYNRERAMKREEYEAMVRRAKLYGIPKRYRNRESLRQLEQMDNADTKKAKIDEWNKLPVRGNTEPPTKPRRGRRPKQR